MAATRGELFAGVTVAIVTPFRNGEVDWDDLGKLVDWHVEFALRHKPLIVVQDRDWASLPDTARERVRDLQRGYVALWSGRLQEVHAGLTAKRARAMAHAAFGLINSTPHSAMLPEPDMRALLGRMALRALGLDEDGARLG